MTESEARSQFWESWRLLQDAILRARAEGCVPAAYVGAADRRWEEAAIMALRLPAPWDGAGELVEEGMRYLRYR